MALLFMRPRVEAVAVEKARFEAEQGIDTKTAEAEAVRSDIES